MLPAITHYASIGRPNNDSHNSVPCFADTRGLVVAGWPWWWLLLLLLLLLLLILCYCCLFWCLARYMLCALDALHSHLHTYALLLQPLSTTSVAASDCQWLNNNTATRHNGRKCNITDRLPINHRSCRTICPRILKHWKAASTIFAAKSTKVCFMGFRSPFDNTYHRCPLVLQ